MKNRWAPWEAAGLMALCAALLLGLWAERRQSALAENIVRLHVIAASDSRADQEEKLRVRDEVLAFLTPRLENAGSTEEARALLRDSLGEVAALAEKVSARPARAELGTEFYPTREYETFSLPAGPYISLRVTLGEGQGHNWWCVVYPPLCTAAAEEVRETAALDEDDIRLITGEDGTYVFKFRIIEWWETITGRGGEN